MRRFATYLVLITWLLAALPTSTAAAEEDGTGLIVVGSPSATSRAIDGIERRVDVLEEEHLPSGNITKVEIAPSQAAEALALLNADPGIAYAELDAVASVVATPTDPLFASQWGVVKTGADAAWDSTLGRAAVTVAVIDTGITASHPDLVGATLLNGHDYVNGDDDPVDDHGHGTSAAGIVAAQHDNGVGIAGICPRCTVLSIKAMDRRGLGAMSDIASAIDEARAGGAKIINLSLGSPTAVTAVHDAVKRAVAEGILVVAAAGNTATNAPYYPATHPEVLSVAGSLIDDSRASQSAYEWPAVAAPWCNLAPNRSGGTSDFCGTSSAAPFVSGIAALLASVEPAASPSDLRTALQSTALSVASVTHGRVDAAAAIRSVDTSPPTVSVSVPNADAARGVIAVSADARDNVAVARVAFSVDGQRVGEDAVAPYEFALDTTKLADGDHVVTVTAIDHKNLTATSDVPIAVANDPAPAAPTGGAPGLPIGGGDGGGGGTPAPVPNPTPTPTPRPTDGQVIGELHPGGTLSTDPERAGPVPGKPTVSVSSPIAGTVSITPAPGHATEGHELLPAAAWDITAPRASAGEPLLLTFSVARADLADRPIAPLVTVVRDGQRLPDCAAPSGATPPPCLSSHRVVDESIQLEVQTDHASVWHLEVPRATEHACPSAGLRAAGFGDVSASSPHATAIACLTSRGLAKGLSATTFGPAASVTRAQMATFLARLVAVGGAELPTRAANRFVDDDASVHHHNINRLTSIGIVSGTSSRRFSPETVVSRAQMAAFLVRTVEYVTDRRLARGTDQFHDDNGNLHEPAINIAASAGLAKGVDGTAFAPSAPVRRDQMASFIARALALLASPPASVTSVHVR